MAQTKGLIVKPASAATAGVGRAVLDPDGDGYVSIKTNGLQRGFQSNDLSESEIPYRPLPVPSAEPMNDLARGPGGGFSDFADMSGTVYPVSSYLSPAGNLMFRFRLGGIAPNSKGYSILVDSDSKFGFSGTNADPDASVDNPGFEFEIVLATNFGVRIYDVNNKTGASTQKGTDADLPYAVYAQKAIAYTTNSGTTDYFYDFYLPFSKITQYFPGVTATTPLRMVANTIMAPQSAIKGPISDISGVNDVAFSSSMAAWSSVITSFVPTTAAGTTSSNFPAIRSDAPVISGTLTTGATTISGTSSEPAGTVITIYRGGIAIGTTTVANGTWTFNVPAGTSINTNDRITATATASGESMSDLSNEVIVQTNCVYSITPNLTCISDKGFAGRVPGAARGTVVNIYRIGDPNTIVASMTTGNTAVTGLTAADEFAYSCSGQYGNSITNCTPGQGCVSGTIGTGTYFAIAVEAGKCESARSNSLCTGTSTTSANPTINTDPVYQSTTVISGTGVGGARIIALADSRLLGVYDIPVGQTTYTISGLTLRSGQTLQVQQVESGKCASVYITRSVVDPTNPPIVNGPIRAGATTITGTSTEPAGTIIQVSYTRAGNTTALSGTATVTGSGTWSFTVSGVTLATSDVITATALAASKTISGSSNAITVSAVPAATPAVPNVTLIGGVAYKEGGTSVSGTGPASTTINVYVDGYLLGTTTSNASGAWTLAGLSAANYDLYTGGKLTATSGTIGSNESAPSNNITATQVIVECIPPASKTASITNNAVCEGSQAEFQITNSEEGIIYTLRNGSAERGASMLGTGGTISFYTFELYATETFSITAQKVSGGTCNPVTISGGTINVNPVPDASKTLVHPASVSSTSVANIVVKASQTGYLYQLRKGTTDIGASKTGTGDDLSLPTDAITEETTYNVLVTDITKATNCTVQLTQTAKIGINPLPVEMLSFTATKVTEGILLNWTTASETNNAFFVAERSSNGREFTALGAVKGAGTTSALTSYQFLDTRPTGTVTYYRLKQVDLDGTFEYSKLVVVAGEKPAAAQFVVYPNPTKGESVIQITGSPEEKAEVTISDAYGKRIATKTVWLTAGKTIMPVNTKNLPAGMYLIRISGQSVQITLKLQKVAE